MPRKPRVVTKSYATAPKTQILIDLLTPLKTEYDNLIKIELNKPGGGSLKDFPSWEEFLRKKLNRTVAEVKTLTGVADYHGLRPTVKLVDARKQLLAKLIELDNKKPGTPAANYTLAEQAGYKPKFVLGKKQGSTAPPGSFKKLLSTQQKILNRVDDVIKNFENLPVDKIKREGGIYRYIGKPFGYTTLEGLQAHMRKFPKKYETARIDFEILQNPGVLEKYSKRGMNARDLLAAFEAGKSGPQFGRILQKGPVSKIMEYASRHIDEGGKLITKLNEESFIYNNKIFSMEPDALSLRQALVKRGLHNSKVIDLVAEAHTQPEFKEIYKVFDELKEIEKIKRPHPLTGKMTPLVTLIKEADNIAYPGRKNAFTKSGLSLDHAHPDGIKGQPFKGIRVATRAMNEAAGQFIKGTTALQPEFGKKVMGYSFKGNILPSLNRYIDNTITKGVARPGKMEAAKLKASGLSGEYVVPKIDTKRFQEIGGRGFKDFEKKYTQVKTTGGYRPPSVNEPRIGVAENYQRILVDQLSKLKKGTPAYNKACGVGKKIMSSLKAAGGRVGYKAAGVVGSCPIIPALEAAPEQTMTELSKLKDETGALGKVKNAATGFLNLAKKGGKFGAIAAVGAASAALVKTFMNDDPSTYLSDENQQKNMLIDMITSPLDDTPQESPAILDWQLPVLGAETVAGTAVTAPSTIEAARSARFGKKPSGITKTALKSLGRGLMTTGTPLGLAALEPLHIAGQIQQGDSLTDVATNPWNYLGPAFMPSMTKAATKGLGAASNVAKVMRLGLPMAAVNAWNPIGWGLLAGSVGIEGYKQYQDYKNKRGWFSDE